MNCNINIFSSVCFASTEYQAQLADLWQQLGDDSSSLDSKCWLEGRIRVPDSPIILVLADKKIDIQSRKKIGVWSRKNRCAELKKSWRAQLKRNMVCGVDRKHGVNYINVVACICSTLIIHTQCVHMFMYYTVYYIVERQPCMSIVLVSYIYIYIYICI